MKTVERRFNDIIDRCYWGRASYRLENGKPRSMITQAWFRNHPEIRNFAANLLKYEDQRPMARANRLLKILIKRYPAECLLSEDPFIREYSRIFLERLNSKEN
jgi:hypothetical protein